MKLRHILIIVCSILLIGFVALVSMMSYGAGIAFGEQNAEKIRAERKKDSTNDTIIPKYVDYEIVENDTTPVIISGFGRVNSTSQINITSEVQGKINAGLTLKKGSKFKKGQVLFSVYDRDARMALSARKSNFLSMISQILPDLKVDYPENFEAWSAFFLKVDVMKPLPKLPNYKTAQEKNFITAKNLISEYLNITSDEERLRKYTIVAPFDGSIIDAFTDEGAIVNPGSPVVSVIRDAKLEIEIQVKTSSRDVIKIGNTVVLTDEVGKTFTGKIERIGSYINTISQTLPVFVSVDHESGELYNGMFLEASITGEGYTNSFELPRRAIFGDENVFTIELDGQDSILMTKHVNIIEYKENSAVITDLEDGLFIVTESVIEGRDSLKVSPNRVQL